MVLRVEDTERVSHLFGELEKHDSLVCLLYRKVGR